MRTRFLEIAFASDSLRIPVTTEGLQAYLKDAGIELASALGLAAARNHPVVDAWLKGSAAKRSP
jgi:hypothetical protein